MINKLFLFTLLTITSTWSSQWSGAQPNQKQQAPQKQMMLGRTTQQQPQATPPQTQAAAQPGQAYPPSTGQETSTQKQTQIQTRVYDYTIIIDQLEGIARLIPENIESFQKSRSNIQTLSNSFLYFTSNKNNTQTGQSMVWDQEAWNNLAGGLKANLASILSDAYFACEDMRQAQHLYRKPITQLKKRHDISHYLNTLENIVLGLEDEPFMQKGTPIEESHYKLFLGYIFTVRGLIQIIKQRLYR